MVYNDEEEEEEEEDINEWINNYKQIEEEYNIFYKKEISSIKLMFIYINKEGQEKWEKKELHLELNADKEKRKSINYATIKNIIKQEEKYKGKKYTFNSLYKYNINLESSEIEDFIKPTKTATITTGNNNKNHPLFFTPLSMNDEEKEDILFEKTIEFFHELNALYIIYKDEENTKKNNLTKRKKITTTTIIKKNTRKQR